MTRLESVRARLMSWTDQTPIGRQSTAKLLDLFEAELRLDERRKVLEECAALSECATDKENQR